ncbi:hypothetical protein [Streptomyces sp. NPDC055013]
MTTTGVIFGAGIVIACLNDTAVKTINSAAKVRAAYRRFRNR